ncbi:MAG: A/G-specific adenine glycosylase [Merismopedia sp. SIO2A8]|nr:A/G-specific adenine glycosylase [Symploca sp. SIO2B6]NET54124.1 A/G-specific adenine glycosylase [Merismopedia sp. SIO2A8]
MRRSLLHWYYRSGRDLPWRHSRDPYPIWISEIMLQQTQVKTVIPYYQKWLETFPTLQSLATADIQLVLKTWQGLGYYARARNIHKAAQVMMDLHGGHFPTEMDAVVALPGIGRTTAGGILSAAFNQPCSILDGNVKRILVRLGALMAPPKKHLNLLWRWSDDLLDPQHPRDFNQAIMDLGATVCLPRTPNCAQCPWTKHCLAYTHDLQTDLPMTEKRSPLPHKLIGVAVIKNEDGQILIDRRRPEGLLGGLWEFPGGKVEPGETIEDCIVREIDEELGISIRVCDHLTTIDHAYSHFRVTLNVYWCEYVSGEPQPIECDEVRWVEPDTLHDYPFPKANEHIIDAILKSI